MDLSKEKVIISLNVDKMNYLHESTLRWIYFSEDIDKYSSYNLVMEAIDIELNTVSSLLDYLQSNYPTDSDILKAIYDNLTRCAKNSENYNLISTDSFDEFRNTNYIKEIIKHTPFLPIFKTLYRYDIDSFDRDLIAYLIRSYHAKIDKSKRNHLKEIYKIVDSLMELFELFPPGQIPTSFREIRLLNLKYSVYRKDNNTLTKLVFDKPYSGDEMFFQLSKNIIQFKLKEDSVIISRFYKHIDNTKNTFLKNLKPITSFKLFVNQCDADSNLYKLLLDNLCTNLYKDCEPKEVDESQFEDYWLGHYSLTRSIGNELALPKDNNIKFHDFYIFFFCKTLASYFPNLSDHVLFISTGFIVAGGTLLDSEIQHNEKVKKNLRKQSYLAYLRQSVKNSLKKTAGLDIIKAIKTVN